MNRVHSYPLLIQRWKSVARKAGRKLQQFALASGFPIYFLRTAKMPDHRTVYLSAGIHGDEPAGTEALIVWAEQNIDQLRAEPFLILPCLNPWGLTHNIRLDALGRDLNREWGPRRRATPVVEAKRLLGHDQFALSLTLHEDYDASGLYIYEVQRDPPFWGEELLDLARAHLPVESRCTIDGHRAEEARCEKIPADAGGDLPAFATFAPNLHDRNAVGVCTGNTSRGADRCDH